MQQMPFQWPERPGEELEVELPVETIAAAITLMARMLLERIRTQEEARDER